MPSVHAGLVGALGETYYHACVPAWLRAWAWRRLTREGRDRDAAMRESLRVLQELREEQQMELQAAVEPATPTAHETE